MGRRRSTGRRFLMTMMIRTMMGPNCPISNARVIPAVGTYKNCVRRSARRSMAAAASIDRNAKESGGDPFINTWLCTVPRQSKTWLSICAGLFTSL